MVVYLPAEALGLHTDKRRLVVWTKTYVVRNDWFRSIVPVVKKEGGAR